MKRIKLSSGKYTLVDNDDFDWLSKWKWSFDGNCASRNEYSTGKAKKIYMHRLIMDFPENMEIDHKNRNRLDNRRSNLRICNRSQNCTNRLATTKGISGYRGVTKRPNGKWQARIEINNRKISLGCFVDVKEAALAYNKLVRKYHGEFALLNNI